MLHFTTYNLPNCNMYALNGIVYNSDGTQESVNHISMDKGLIDNVIANLKRKGYEYHIVSKIQGSFLS